MIGGKKSKTEYLPSKNRRSDGKKLEIETLRTKEAVRNLQPVYRSGEEDLSEF